MTMAFFRNLFKRNKPADVPAEQPQNVAPAAAERPKTQWQKLVAEELVAGHITEADKALLHEVDLPVVLNYDSIVATLQRKVKSGYVAPKLNPERQERNKQFEDFLLKKFDKRAFKLLERNGLMDQTVDADCKPIMRPHFVFSTGKTEPQTFALECKYALHNQTNGIVCSGKSILARAKLFERDCQIPVFIIVARGGTPDLPEHLYVIPVRDVQSNFVPDDQLIGYEKDVDEPFRFDRNNLKLY